MFNATSGFKILRQNPEVKPIFSLFYTNPASAIALAIAVFALILMTLIGNLMVCFAIALVRKLKSQPANLLIVSLAIADFLVGLLVMPIALVDLLDERWILGDIICRFWTTADLTLCTASILNLCMICVDRYMAVTRALRYIAQRTTKRILLYIAVVWIGAFFVSATPLILLPLDKVENTCQVSQNKFYQLYATIIAFYGPCCIMILLYISMWRAAKRLRKATRLELLGNGSSPVKRQYAGGKKPVERHSAEPIELREGGKKYVTFRMTHSEPKTTIFISSSRENASALLQSRQLGEDKALKTLCVICGVFIVCWLPFFVITLAKSQYPTLRVPKWVHDFVLWLGYSNSMLNPLIYAYFNREFRIPFREMLCCRFSTIKDVMRNEEFTRNFGLRSSLIKKRIKLRDELNGGASVAISENAFSSPC